MQCRQSITASPCCSILLTLFPGSNVDSSHRLQSFRTNLLQSGSFLQAAVLKSKSLLVWVLQGPQILLGDSALVRVLHELQLLQGISTCYSVRSSMGCSVGICTGVLLAASKYVLRHGLFHRLQHLDHLLPFLL